LGERSSLPTYLEIVNRRIATLSERHLDALHDLDQALIAADEDRWPYP